MVCKWITALGLAIQFISASSAAFTLDIDKNTLKFANTPDAKPIILKPVGQGTRSKKIALFSIKVYEAELFVSESTQLPASSDEILKSPYISLIINPARSFPGEKMKQSVLDSYEENKINSETEAQKKFIDLFKDRKINKNEAITLFGQQTDHSSQLFIKMGNEHVEIAGPKNFVKEVFSIWLGATTDKNLEKLKSDLLSVKETTDTK